MNKISGLVTLYERIHVKVEGFLFLMKVIIYYKKIKWWTYFSYFSWQSESFIYKKILRDLLKYFDI